jgi:hypothetical protein
MSRLESFQDHREDEILHTHYGRLDRRNPGGPIPLPLFRDPSVPPRAASLWTLLAQIADLGSSQLPTHHNLAGMLNCSASTIKWHLSALDAAGWIVRTRRNASHLWDIELLDGPE